MDKAKLDTVIGKYKVGSLLNVPLSIAQTKEKWAEAIKQIQELSMKEIGIPCIYGVDQIHGTTYTLGGTLFPQGVNMGASFNRKPKSRRTKPKRDASPGHTRRWSTWEETRAGRACGRTMERIAT